MASAVRNTVRYLGVDLPSALRMASAVPAAFLGLDGEFGRIARGYRADMVLLDAELDVGATWINGLEDGAHA
jgi:N-acetylglucosamine-6-phosphate deacetylase